MRKVISVLLLALIVFAGCSNESASEGVTQEVEKLSMMEKIVESGTLRVGISLTGPPVGARDDKGNPYGYDVDFAQKIADTLGVKLEITEVNGETRIPMLTSGRVDLVLANMTGTIERAKSINFSIPYLRAGIKMMVQAGSSIVSLEDLNMDGMKIAVARGTTGEALAKANAPKAELVYVNDFTNQLLLVKQGKADATFEDSSLLDFAAAESAGELITLPELYTSDPICIGIPKGDMDFVRWIDMFVSWQINNGWQAETYKKWWGQEPTASMVAPW